MRILQICNKVPFPPKDGGCIAMNNLTQGLLNEGHEVKVLAINTPKHFTNVNLLSPEYISRTNIETVFIDTSVKLLPAFLNLFSKDSYNITRFYSEEFEEKIADTLKEKNFDVVQLEGLFVSMYAPVIRRHSKAKIVLRAHNVEHKLWERNAKASGSLIKKKYFSFLAGRLKEYELGSLSSFDGIAAITAGDKKWFLDNGFKKNVTVIPFGIDLQSIKNKTVVSETEKNSVLHIASMDWQPNIEGLKWFLENVWSKVEKKHPDIKLYLAGRKMGGEFQRLNKENVIVIGEVEDAHEFIASKGLMVVPLLSGGGMRVKIIEGMALGKVIVTTTVGAEGIDAEHGKNILIADTVEEFADAINTYLSDGSFLSEIGERARQFAFEHYNNADISKRLSFFYSSIN
jgi:polysaccharide biosynthesis protein PslH